MITEKSREILKTLLNKWHEIDPKKFRSSSFVEPGNLEKDFEFERTPLSSIYSMCLGGWLCRLTFDGVNKELHKYIESYLLHEISGSDNSIQQWLFSGSWPHDVDHAKARVEYLLEHGDPPACFNYKWKPEQKKNNDMSFINIEEKTNKNMVKGSDIKSGDVFRFTDGERWVALSDTARSRMSLDRNYVIGMGAPVTPHAEFELIGSSTLTVIIGE